jgi:para-nitrobenzyl esterase
MLKTKEIRLLRYLSLVLVTASGIAALNADEIQTKSGTVAGRTSADAKIRVYKGIPFATPPVGKLRWQPPQPAASWEGVRKATEFGARCMQGNIFSDMVFRDNGPSEDCLYLNVWTPTSSPSEHLPVMVWIYGGGFQAGAASEPRQDGESLARKGVVVVSFNYRLGIFGFFSHPELAKESPHGASGNYGLLDQVATLQWVHDNIAAFGGDPANVTIFGESAGSISVSAHMASPLSKDLIKAAIGESGAVFMLTPPMPPASQTEEQGAHFATSTLGANSLDALRAKSADELLQATLKNKTDLRFWPNVDGYFFPESPAEIYRGGKQAHVPLLAGWNLDEQPYQGFLGKEPPTPQAYAAKVRSQFSGHADEILKLYPGRTESEVKESARDLASDQFIAYSTWKWLDMQVGTGSAPVYRYHFEQAPPQPPGEPSRGAYHSADIEFVFQALDSKHLPWTDADRKLSDLMSSYWANFAKTGDPNGAGLPIWPAYKASSYEVMHLKQGSAGPSSSPDMLRARYELLNRIADERAKVSNGKTNP